MGSNCTIVFACIPRLLAVVVSLTFFAALLRYKTDRKVITAVLVYDKQKIIAPTYYTLDIFPLKNSSISYIVEIYASIIG